MQYIEPPNKCEEAKDTVEKTPSDELSYKKLLGVILELITVDQDNIDYNTVLKNITDSIEDNDILNKYILAGVSRLDSKQQVDILLDGMNKLGI